MKDKIFKEKRYKHIDKRIKIKEATRIVKDKEYVIKHGFYPFLAYTNVSEKYVKLPKSDSQVVSTLESQDNTENKYKRKVKERDIKYASHIDRNIYQWYSYQLNEQYNNYCDINDLNQSVIAYRTCLKGKTNIEFSKIAFDYIKQVGPCYILVSDFSNFFDTIDHKKLKENMCKVLNVNSLPEDFYKVYKSMTSYSYIEKKALVQYLINNKIETEKTLKKCNSLLDHTEWKKVKKDLKPQIIKNTNSYGIPQGSPLSGVFANVYMIDFDEKLSGYAKSNNGIYMRYSDDIIVIIPADKVNSIDDIWNEISDIKKEYPTLEINVDKTSGYLYQNNTIKSLHKSIKGMKNGQNCVKYLGFSFDGKNVKFRDKTITKFFYKLYRRIDSMVSRDKKRRVIGEKRQSKIDKHQIIKGTKINNSDSKKFINYLNRTLRVYPNEVFVRNFKKRINQKIFARFDKKSQLQNLDETSKK